MKIDVQPDVNWFKLSTDRKVAFFARPKGSVSTNGFGLPMGREWSCKDATDWCEGVCYADLPWPNVQALLHHNWDMYQQNKHSVHRLVGMLRPLVEESRRWARKRDEPHVFRWFWSGDIPGRNFATAMRTVALLYPYSTFWVYTWDETAGLAALFEGERKGPRCPELTGKIPLLVWGDGGTGRGACVECGMCLTGINNVRFASGE